MRLTIEQAKQKGYRQRELTDPFIGACSLKLDMPETDCSDYARSVNFETADSVVAWRDRNGLFHRRAFASRADGVIAVEVKSPEGTSFDLCLELARIERDLETGGQPRSAQPNRGRPPEAASSNSPCWKPPVPVVRHDT